MLRSIALAIVLMSTLAAAGHGENQSAAEMLTREHFIVIDERGASHRITELLFVGDVDAFVTLWQTPDRKRYILESAHNLQHLNVINSIAEVGTPNFLRVSYPIPVSPDGSVVTRKHRALALSPGEWEVPHTIATADFEIVAPVPASAHIARIRGEVTQRIDREFRQEVREVVGLAARAGSPAGLNVCQTLGPLVLDGAKCSRTRQVHTTPAPDDCEFEATFGYPCHR
jgi:hypothetical protein